MIYAENNNIQCIGKRGINNDIIEIEMNGGNIKYKELVGWSVVFFDKETNKTYDIDILSYLKIKKSYYFEVKYEKNVKTIRCRNLINRCQIKKLIKKRNELNKVSEKKSKHKFYTKDNHHVMVIDIKNSKNRDMFDKDFVEVLFDGDDMTVESIKNTTWCIGKGNSKNGFYVQTSSYNKTNVNKKLHQIVFGDISKGNVIDHINGDRLDNRLCNLREVSKSENSKNKTKSGLPQKRCKGWYYEVNVNGRRATSPSKKTYEEADIDALIIQRHYGFKHRENEWYKLKNIGDDYVMNLIKIIENKLNKNVFKNSNFNKNYYEDIILENSEECLKVYNNKGLYTYISKEDEKVLNLSRLLIRNNGYWGIVINGKNYMIHRYLLGITETNVSNIYVDHLNNKPNDNRRSNLVLTTNKGNLANKNSKGYSYCKSLYMVHYISYWEHISKHKDINNIKYISFKNESDAIKEVAKRKWLANYIRPIFKDFDEYNNFIKTNTFDDLDEYWIKTKFPNINTINILSQE